MGGRGGSSGLLGGSRSEFNSVSNQRGIKNYQSKQSFYIAQSKDTFKKMTGITFSYGGREIGLYSPGNPHLATVTDLRTGVSFGTATNVKEVMQLTRKGIKYVKNNDVSKYEENLRKYKKRK